MVCSSLIMIYADWSQLADQTSIMPLLKKCLPPLVLPLLYMQTFAHRKLQQSNSWLNQFLYFFVYICIPSQSSCHTIWKLLTDFVTEFHCSDNLIHWHKLEI